MTIEETWNYGKDRGQESYSHTIGHVQYLHDQHNIILNSAATADDDSPPGTPRRIGEVDANDPDSGEIFELEVRGKEEDSVEYTYRTWRFPLYPEGEWDFSVK